ncbi:hypothetical protein Pvag_2424 [Pantoea vagans C9-1]|nr:hypothetical protein Pvag_2424 [Pantoea vagans C9-1]
MLAQKILLSFVYNFIKNMHPPLELQFCITDTFL